MRNMQPKSRRITDALLMGLIKGEKEKEGAPLNNPKQAQLAGPNLGLWAKHAGHSLAQIPRPGQNGGPGPGPAQTADTKKTQTKHQKNTPKTQKKQGYTKNTPKPHKIQKHKQNQKKAGCGPAQTTGQGCGPAQTTGQSGPKKEKEKVGLLPMRGLNNPKTDSPSFETGTGQLQPVGGTQCLGRKRDQKRKTILKSLSQLRFLHADRCRLVLVACKNLRWDKDCKVVSFLVPFLPRRRVSPMGTAALNVPNTPMWLWYLAVG